MEKYTILIAEDDPINQKVIKNYLNSSEFDLIFANNGSDAIEIIKNGKKIDLVLMDLKMPEIDGFVAGGLIKKFLPEVPIIVQSAYTEEIVRNRIDRKIFNEFITKPIDIKQLYKVLRKYLRTNVYNC